MNLHLNTPIYYFIYFLLLFFREEGNRVINLVYYAVISLLSLAYFFIL